MPGKLSDAIGVFSRGLGLKITTSFMPPCAVAWVFFILYLLKINQYEPGAFAAALWLGLAGIGIGSAVVIWLILANIPALRQVVLATIGLAKGDLDSPIPYRDRRDETGDVARALQIFKESALENRQLHLEQEQQRLAAEATKRDALRAMASTVEAEAEVAVGDIIQLTTEMTKASGKLHDVAIHTSDSAAESSLAAADAMASSEVVAAASEQLHASIAEIASQLESTRSVAHSAVLATQTAKKSMARLSEATTRIGSVVDLISNIASQTNLLALNATIEAARAGDAGKGFAVVAGEVKLLASQTGKATDEITTQIAEVTDGVVLALEAMNGIASTITEVEMSTTAISAAIEEQSAATSEIARAVHHSALASNKVSSVMEGLTEAASQSRDLSDDVKKDGNRIAETVAALRRTIGRVIRTSAPDVNRRMAPRLGVLIPCKVARNGCSSEGALNNLSSGGVCLSCEDHDIHVGDELTIQCAEFGMAKKVRVVAVKDQLVHAAFAPIDVINPNQIQQISQKGTQTLIQKAKSDHEAFVADVMAVLDGSSDTKASDLANHHTSRLGKWYDSVSDERISSCKAFIALVEPHKLVHASGRGALECYWEKDELGARRAADALKQASHDVVALLNSLSDEVKRAIEAHAPLSHCEA